MRLYPIALGVVGVVAAALIVAVPDWTHPPISGVQYGPGPSMIRFEQGLMPEPVSQTAPAPLPPAETGGQSATAAYKNVQVLTDVSAPEFMRLQQAITAWVSPKQGCAFCHVDGDMASDAKPQKQVARLMLQMTRHLNADWGEHVAGAGVTCYTCHRGQPMPAEAWFPHVPAPQSTTVARQENWYEAADNVRKFFPDNGWELFMLQDNPISVESTTSWPSQTVADNVVAKRVYEMMMQMSDGIGANCVYCHNSRALSDWSQSTPMRWTGQSGLNMTRELNRNFLTKAHALLSQSYQRTVTTSLPVLPDFQSGTQPANAFVICATCHLARTKPLEGVNMVHDYPGLAPAKAAGNTQAEARR